MRTIAPRFSLKVLTRSNVRNSKQIAALMSAGVEIRQVSTYAEVSTGNDGGEEHGDSR